MSLRVLIVDDSPAMRWFLRRVIGLSGFDGVSVLEASDGREGFALLQDYAVDLILADINMPNMNGEEFLRRIAEDENLRLVPVVIISANACDRSRRAPLPQQPISPEAFRQELEDVLDAPNVC